MTHLRIEQSNSAIEQVSSDVITKLYELATSGELNLDSNLVGRLHTTATYLEYIDELEELFQDLYISCDNKYIAFEDKTTEAEMISRYSSDGIGLTLSDANAVTSMANFKASTFKKFNELSKIANVHSLPNSCFENNKYIEEINLSNINTGDLYACFYLCTNLKKVIFGSALTTIGGGAFLGCTSLNNIILPESLKTIGSNCFRGCSSLTSVVIPNTVTSIGENAFNQCTSLSDITLSNQVTTYQTNVFAKTAIVNITFPDGVTSIGYTCFDNCKLLKTVILPSSITSIGQWAFGGTTNLQEVIFEGTTPPSLGTNPFNNSSSNYKIYVPDSAVSTYQLAWSQYSSRIYSINSRPTT